METFQPGRLYFINDEFFKKIGDNFLKNNKPDTKRPHYYTFADKKTGLLWVIPCSTQINKYESIIANRRVQNKPHNHIQIIKVSGKEQAFLFQDMFPILPKYIDSAYKNQYGFFEIRDPNIISAIEKNANKIISLIKRGIKFTPTQPNVTRIESIMIAEREAERQLTLAKQDAAVAVYEKLGKKIEAGRHTPQDIERFNQLQEQRLKQSVESAKQEAPAPKKDNELSR